MQNSAASQRQFNRSLKPLLQALFVIGVIFVAVSWYTDHQRLKREMQRISEIAEDQRRAHRALEQRSYDNVHRIRQRSDRELLRAKLEGRPITVSGVKADGRLFDWADYLGKLVVVHCWSAGCCKLSCPDDFPAMKDLHSDYRDFDLHIVSLSLDHPSRREEALSLLEQHDVPWTNLLPTAGQSPQVNGRALEWPMTLILVDRDSSVLAVLDTYVESQKDKNSADAHVQRLRKRLDEYFQRTGK